jgi:hypothetical protein
VALRTSVGKFVIYLYRVMFVFISVLLYCVESPSNLKVSADSLVLFPLQFDMNF